MTQKDATSPVVRPHRAWQPYRVLAVSVYATEAEIADRLTTALRYAGWPRANRSFVIREALWRLYDDLIKKKLFAKIGVHAHPPVIRAENTRTDTGQLRTDEITGKS